MSTWYEDAHGTVHFVTRSTSDEFFPPTDDYVRGNIVLTGYQIRSHARKPKWVDVTLVAHTELGGTIPSTIVNMLVATAPYKILSGIRKHTAIKKP